ncbi:MAG: tetratricopeptide repeat protein [Gammaproteobacteria bacterium]
MRPPGCDRRAQVAATLAAILLLGAGLASARDAAGLVVEDPHFGEVLFYFYQQNDFDALTHLMAAQASGRVSKHEVEAELLRGGLNLAYGQHRDAGKIFNRLLADVSDPLVRNRAWFYLGKVRFQRARYGEAEAALRQVQGNLPPALEAEYVLLLAQSLMAQSRFAEATVVLDGWKGAADWTAYTRFNLGVAQVRNEQLEAGARALNRVGRMSARTPELASLRDKANLALGYARLQAGEADQARAVLQRVRLQGPFSNKALLGVGWADALQDNYRRALVPWLELGDRDLLDGAVQESLLAVPYAFGRLDAHGSAVDHYLTALDAFGTELSRLDVAITRARDGELVPALLRADDPEIGRWYWQLEDVPDSEDGRYLYQLVADHAFQDGLRNYRDLLGLHEHLQEWQDKLAAFEDMVDTRAEAYAERLPPVAARMQNVNLATLRARRDAVAEQLTQIRASRDVVGLANRDERAQWELLAELERSPAWSHPDAAEAREKQRVLKGLLSWELDADYRFRSWQQGHELATLDEALLESDRGMQEVYATRDQIPGHLADYRARIVALQPRLNVMQDTVLAVLGGQQKRLQLYAVNELEAQKERLLTYRVQARFALATIYDRADAQFADRVHAR